MKIRIILLITSLAVLTSYVHGAGHKGSEALEILALIEGKYTYEFKEVGSDPVQGKINFELFANDQFVMFDEKFDVNDPDSVEVHGIVGYDKVDGIFTWHRIFSNGGYDFGRGRLNKGAITFQITKTRLEAFGEKAWGGPGIKLRTKWFNFSKKGFDVTWEQSKDGGPWELINKGRLDKQ